VSRRVGCERPSVAAGHFSFVADATRSRVGRMSRPVRRRDVEAVADRAGAFAQARKMAGGSLTMVPAVFYGQTGTAPR